MKQSIYLIITLLLLPINLFSAEERPESAPPNLEETKAIVKVKEELLFIALAKVSLDESKKSAKWKQHRNPQNTGSDEDTEALFLPLPIRRNKKRKKAPKRCGGIPQSTKNILLTAPTLPHNP